MTLETPIKSSTLEARISQDTTQVKVTYLMPQDIIYFSKLLKPTFAKYLPNPFSDHYSYITKILTDDISQKSFVPKPRPSFKIHPR